MHDYSNMKIVDGMPENMGKEIRECIKKQLKEVRKYIDSLEKQAQDIDNMSDEELNAKANEAFGGLIDNDSYMYETSDMEDEEPKMDKNTLGNILFQQKFGDKNVELPKPESVNPQTYIPATDMFVDSVLSKMGKQDMKAELYQELQQQKLNNQNGYDAQAYQQSMYNNMNTNYGYNANNVYSCQQPVCNQPQMMYNNMYPNNYGYTNNQVYQQPQQYNYYNNNAYSNMYSGNNMTNNYTNQYNFNNFTSNNNSYSYGTTNTNYGYGYKPWINAQITIPEIYPHSANNPGVFGETNPYIYYGIPYQYGYNDYAEDMIKEYEQQRQYRCNTDVFIIKRDNKYRFYDQYGNFDQEEYDDFCNEIEEWYGFTPLKELAEKRKEYEKEQLEKAYKEAEEAGKIDLFHSEQDSTGYDLNGVRRFRTKLCVNIHDINDPSKIIRTIGPDDPETGYRIIERTWEQDMISRNLYQDWCRVDYENYCRNVQIQQQATAIRRKWDKLYDGKTMKEQIAAYYEETETKPRMEQMRMEQMRRLWDKNKYRNMFASNGINTDIKFSNTSTAFNYNYDMAVDLKKAQQQYSVDELNNNKQLTAALNQNYNWKKERFMGNIRKGDCTSDVSFLQNNGTPIVYHKPLDEINLEDKETITFEHPERYIPGSDIPRKTTITHGTLSDEEAQRVMNEPGGVMYEEVVNI